MKTILCEIFVIDEGGIPHPLAHVKKPYAKELSQRENGRRILELASEQLPPEKKAPRPD